MCDNTESYLEGNFISEGKVQHDVKYHWSWLAERNNPEDSISIMLYTA